MSDISGYLANLRRRYMRSTFDGTARDNPRIVDSDLGSATTTTSTSTGQLYTYIFDGNSNRLIPWEQDEPHEVTPEGETVSCPRCGKNGLRYEQVQDTVLLREPGVTIPGSRVRHTCCKAP